MKHTTSSCSKFERHFATGELSNEVTKLYSVSKNYWATFSAPYQPKFAFVTWGQFSSVFKFDKCIDSTSFQMTFTAVARSKLNVKFLNRLFLLTIQTRLVISNCCLKYCFYAFSCNQELFFYFTTSVSLIVFVIAVKFRTSFVRYPGWLLFDSYVEDLLIYSSCLTQAK